MRKYIFALVVLAGCVGGDEGDTISFDRPSISEGAIALYDFAPLDGDIQNRIVPDLTENGNDLFFGGEFDVDAEWVLDEEDPLDNGIAFLDRTRLRSVRNMTNMTEACNDTSSVTIDVVATSVGDLSAGTFVEFANQEGRGFRVRHNGTLIAALVSHGDEINGSPQFASNSDIYGLVRNHIVVRSALGGADVHVDLDRGETPRPGSDGPMNWDNEFELYVGNTFSNNDSLDLGTTLHRLAIYCGELTDEQLRANAASAGLEIPAEEE